MLNSLHKKITSIKNEYVEYIKEQLSPLGIITAKRMFGGYGVYANKIIVGIIVDNELYLKITNHSNNSEAEMTQFTYTRNNKIVKLPYWKIPEEILEDPKKLKTLMMHTSTDR